MKDLQMIFFGTFVSSLLLLLLALTFLTLFVIKKQQVKKIKSEKLRSKSQRRKQKKELERLIKGSEKALVTYLVFLLLGIGTGGGAYFISYYQAINLSEKDKELVTNGYYLLSDFEKQLKNINKDEMDLKKSSQNIQNLGGAMASYSGLKASNLNKEAGQIKLNRYYNIVKELGVNATGQSQEFFENKELVEEFLKDIKKAQGYQKEIFKYYKVDDGALKAKE